MTINLRALAPFPREGSKDEDEDQEVDPDDVLTDIGGIHESIALSSHPFNHSKTRLYSIEEHV